jgi:hypothetical protein
MGGERDEGKIPWEDKAMKGDRSGEERDGR